jgi:hypothetical protein
MDCVLPHRCLSASCLLVCSTSVIISASNLIHTIHRPRKATLLYSNIDIEALWRPLGYQPDAPRCSTVERWEDESGRSRVRGNAHLKATQAYPPDFGLAVGRFFANTFGSSYEGLPLAELPHVVCDETHTWDDAALSDVLRDLAAM